MLRLSHGLKPRSFETQEERRERTSSLQAAQREERALAATERSATAAEMAAAEAVRANKRAATAIIIAAASAIISAAGIVVEHYISTQRPIVINIDSSHASQENSSEGRGAR